MTLVNCAQGARLSVSVQDGRLAIEGPETLQAVALVLLAAEDEVPAKLTLRNTQAPGAATLAPADLGGPVRSIDEEGPTMSATEGVEVVPSANALYLRTGPAPPSQDVRGRLVPTRTN